jgi:hypothetical protein
MFRSKQIPFHKSTFPDTYEQLKRDGMPPSAFRSDMFVPEDLGNYPAVPTNGEGRINFDKSDAPAMRVQAFFIPGGLVLSMYMHHSVFDFSGITTFWKAFSTNVSKASGETLLAKHDTIGIPSPRYHHRTVTDFGRYINHSHSQRAVVTA